MSEAYLSWTVSPLTTVRKVRRLPLKGTVHVVTGQKVEPSTVVAETLVPGRTHMVAAAKIMNIEPGELSKAMVKKVGDRVQAGEVMARHTAFFGLIRGQCQSPATGVVEHISDVTGQVVIREPEVPVAVKAYLAGTVTKVLPEEGVEVETTAAFIQGIFGIGGEGSGKLVMAANGPGEVLTPRQITDGHRGCILVGGSLVTAAALRRAEKVGVRGIICGCIHHKDLCNYLGYEIRVASTGHEDISLSLVITEGFGQIPMAQKTFALLKTLEGLEASINGSTQLGAGVLSPEIVVPRTGKGLTQETAAKGLEIGGRVRLVRNPWFGKLGKVIALPVELQKIESEARVRVVEVELEGGRQVTVPRANVEITGTVLPLP